MKKCPKCGKEYERLLALSRRDNKTMICDVCGMKEALEDFAKYRKATPQERTKAAVYATGNKWAIENYEATHS
ncbi:MAG: hypothetical protein K6G83_15900 [Lachnospiraceae bacterium]|nr:hypothetical protein [Lachnospiraceae bacterium]